jgi:hypothetical protein
MKFSPMGFSHVLHLCLQGGGVFVQSGTVTISSSTISGNTAAWVRASLIACKSPIALIIALKIFNRPDGKTADALCLTHACTTANDASVNLGQLQGVRATETLKTSHRPDGKVADMLSPTHACTTANASGQLQGVHAAETLKVSQCPHGRLTFCSFLQGGGVAVGGGTVSISSSTISGNTAANVCTLMFKTSHRPDGRLTFCSIFAGRWCFCRGWHGRNNVFLDHRQYS